MTTHLTEPDQVGDILFHLRLAVVDGPVVEDSFDGEPLRIQPGRGELLAAIEQRLLQLAAGERRSFTLSPLEAFGVRDEVNIHRIPHVDFPVDLTVTTDQIIAFTTPSGEEIPGRVVAIEAEAVLVDFNHPLAGHRIEITLQLLQTEERPCNSD